jgi:hypothetical protein
VYTETVKGKDYNLCGKTAHGWQPVSLLPYKVTTKDSAFLMFLRILFAFLSEKFSGGFLQTA